MVMLKVSETFVFNDGGREEAGYKGFAGDCVVRAIAIATQLPYKKVYKDLFNLSDEYSLTRRNKIAASIDTRGASPRNGVFRDIYQSYLESLGWKWVAVMKIGTGCTMHLRKDELPAGRIIARVSKHLVAVIDGVIHDNHDCSRDGTRAVYGYFIK